MFSVCCPIPIMIKLLWVGLQFILVPVVPVFASVVFEDCGSAYDLYAVNIEGCGMRLPCFVTLGEETPVNLEFRADFEPEKLDQNVVININHISTKTNVTPELCDSEMCPVRTDTLTSFYSVMSVPDNMALNQRGYLRWRISNERGVQVLCYSVLVQTQSISQKMIRTKLGIL